MGYGCGNTCSKNGPSPWGYLSDIWKYNTNTNVYTWAFGNNTIVRLRACVCVLVSVRVLVPRSLRVCV